MDERKAQTGDRRFACACGEHYFDSLIALHHTLLGHESVLERYSHGKWFYHPTPVAFYMAEQLASRNSGENMEMFLSRLEHMADNAETELKALNIVGN